MATLAELSQQRLGLQNQIDRLEAAILADRRQIGLYDQRLVVLPQNSPQRQSFERSIQQLQDKIQDAGIALRRLQSELDAVKSQIAAINQAPIQSTGQTVQRDSQGRQEAANTTSPPAAGTVEVGPDGRVKKPPTSSNATRPSISPTTGTNDPTRPLSSTQTIPPPTSATPIGGSSPAAYPGAQSAARSGSDDAGNVTQQRLNLLFGGDQGRIITQPNVLDSYLSYTYNASIYILTPGQYQQLMSSKQKNLSGFQLLMRSGGAPTNTDSYTPQATTVTDPGEIPGVTTFSQAGGTGRNQFFPLDYYLDDIKMRSIIQGKGTGGAHNVVELNFKIFEPNGISLLPNLYKAADQIAQLSGKAGRQNYAGQIYLMVMRFYGQNQDGTLVPIKGSYFNESGESVTNPEVIEKFIPFMFTAIKFRVVQKVTEYECSAVCPQNMVNTGRGRGTIPYNVEITSKTLRDLFAGKVGFSSTQQTSNIEGRQVQEGATASGLPREARGVPASAVDQVTAITRAGVSGSTAGPPAPPKADAARTPTINQGLFEALNKYQEDQRAAGIITYADEYSIEIDPVLADARVVPPGQINKSYTAMNTGQTARDKKDPATNRVDNTTKNTSAIAGMSIVQFIDQYTRTSTYIYDQQIVSYDPKTGNPVVSPSVPGQVLAWYHIGLQAEPKLDQWDPKRNDYAYRIKFSLTPYQVNDLKSDYFPQGRYQGAHKAYDFWFTGQNSQIINFEQDFNYLYYLVINNPIPTQLTGQTTSYDQYKDEIRRYYQPRSDQSSQGQDKEVNEPSANAADYLYSPADQARVKMTIIGDPSWIQQGELWQGVSGTGYGQAFLPDGTISYDNREILFQIAFNMPTDYDLGTGLMDVGANNLDANRSQNIPGRARQSYIYRAITCTSDFSQGKFTQELEGVLIQFDLPRATPASAAVSGAEPNPRRESQATAASNTTNSNRTGALGAGNGVDFSGSEFGAYFGSGETGGAVNYNPRGLSTVLDSPRPLITDSIGAEGFGAEALGIGETTPPTSSGIVIEPLSSARSSATPGSAPPITPITQETSEQLELKALNKQLDQAISRGNTAEIARLNTKIRDVTAKSLRDNPPAPSTQSQQVVKDR